MQSYRKIEIVVGLFVLLGIIGMGWMAAKLGQVGGLADEGYPVTATFSDVGGVRDGSDVMVAGVVVGRVSNVRLKGNEHALVTMTIQPGVQLTTDVIASVRTKGIIGERYIRLTQGADTEILESGDEIEETESALNIEDLVSKYIFNSSE
ncbi:MAG: outer membrane lipid asymmetry maintenance protein MlaD [Zetaproteobacteria bacterium CG_4_9_14_3_um_filter_49_83]|nr:MAG: outer membrane lipid asymmetry maintenance protein MlaD [Zetaproteobacteria bacterium CG1_02_49_23]PIQ30030.1 MAG: outer membrane lipid asymmetry maintenance protein MlaD [Zetaproteobacteria bacterium CG17_big_fil_post_rev_8_21_14_2_50_50_13]PIV29228.1 MAG: outer membrane lipid asymmetry maintenance protein MlaD [Zetaproteobacteria bacterium CG02_land_8_20_14_3_00_50_9]PIY56022.1 MAG: outer membrane lipid asymmetry maintenance protein MlaD [Zetaproteobacteria bacterium CG_4_10_14_0_8_um_